MYVAYKGAVSTTRAHRAADILSRHVVARFATRTLIYSLNKGPFGFCALRPLALIDGFGYSGHPRLREKVTSFHPAEGRSSQGALDECSVLRVPAANWHW